MTHARNSCHAIISLECHGVMHDFLVRLQLDAFIVLNWKLKVSNTADNAGITQSQARDTRYRQMQELNSLCVSK